MKKALLGLLLITATADLTAERVWMIGGLTSGIPAAPCRHTRWVADAILHNPAAEPRTVQALHVSNGGGGLTTTGVVITGAARASDVGLRGAAATPIWVTELEVPQDVVVEGRLEWYYDPCGGAPPALVPAGVVRMPTYRRMNAPGERQIHVGTDFGVQDIRQNIGIYNAGTMEGLAVITVRRPFCSDPPIHVSASIPADTLIQVGLGTIPPCVAPNQSGPRWAAVTEVSVDRPSLTYVVTLTNSAAVPGISVSQ